MLVKRSVKNLITLSSLVYSVSKALIKAGSASNQKADKNRSFCAESDKLIFSVPVLFVNDFGAVLGLRPF